jgi:hypothetical protein
VSLLTYAGVLLHRLRSREAVGVALPPSGEVVWIRKSSSQGRLRARIGSSSEKRLSVVLAPDAPEQLGVRDRVELEWIDLTSLVQVSARVAAVRGGPPPVLELRVRGKPRLAERRGSLRAAAPLPVSGWSLHDPTRLLTGLTVDLSVRGALLELPMTPETASTLELTIELQGRPFHARGRIVRAAGDLIAVELEPTGPEDAVRLRAFVEERLKAEGSAGKRPPAPPS